jgi:Golgi nucleoside diphosphatase
MLELAQLVSAVRWALIIDAGSSGSRGYVFCAASGGGETVQTFSSKKVYPGLSSFSSKPEGAAEYLKPVFAEAATIMPAAEIPSATVKLLATGGMRLLSQQRQQAIYDVFRKNFYSEIGQYFPFRLDKASLVTVSGNDEAYYALLAANYLAGSVTAAGLRVQGSSPVGIIDLVSALDQSITRMHVIFLFSLGRGELSGCVPEWRFFKKLQ